MPKIIHEGWMLRYGRRKIGKTFNHSRYFILEPNLLAYYKKKPTDKNAVPQKTLVLDGNFRVEDRGMKTHHDKTIYVLCVYNKKAKHHHMTIAAGNIQDVHTWKEKIELVIDQYGPVVDAGNKTFASSDFCLEDDKNVSSSDQESLGGPEDEGEIKPTLLRTNTMGKGPPESILDWTREPDIGLSSQSMLGQTYSRKNWRLIRCQNGLRIFEELLNVDSLPRSCSRAMKAVGLVNASCEAIFELVLSMDTTRFEWDSSFQYGSLVEEVDGHTAVVYHRLQFEWCSKFIWPRDLCYVRYWRHNDDGSYVVLFRSRQHSKCGPQPGFVRAHIESGGFKISPLKPRNGQARTQVQHLMQIDLGWIVGYIPSFQQHCLVQLLSSVAGMREFFSQTDEIQRVPKIPIVAADIVTSKKGKKIQESVVSLVSRHVRTDTHNSLLLEEDSDENEDEELPKTYSARDGNDIKHQEEVVDEDTLDHVDLSLPGMLRRDDDENSRNCWRIPDGKNFKIRSKTYPSDKTKIPGGKYLMKLAAVDWLKDKKRIDHVAQRDGCAAQVAAEKGFFSFIINLQIPGSTHYSMVFYHVKKQLVPGSLLQRFVDGDEEFRNSRLKLIPSVPKGSWIVRQSVGSNPVLLGKALDCTYIRGVKYLEVFVTVDVVEQIDVDIGSSAVANGVLGLVLGVLTSLVIDMAFLVEGVTSDELPEQLLGAIRVSHVELSSAVSIEAD